MKAAESYGYNSSRYVTETLLGFYSMALSISFAAGPLAQVGLNILSWDTTYHLAVNAYGWYKARERSQALTDIFTAASGELVATSSFNRRTYVDRRRDDRLQGVVVQEGLVQTTALPKASTALPDHAGLACLRALTTALLCFYGSSEIVVILSEVVPRTLVQHHQEDTPFEVRGPLRSALQQYVEAIAREEDINTFKYYIQVQLTKRQDMLTGASLQEIMSCDPSHPLHIQGNDIQLVLGALEWILRPMHERPTIQYLTRSLRVWTVAVAMMEVGFEISAYPETLSSVESYEDFTKTTTLRGRHPAVALVTAPVGDTDAMTFKNFLANEAFQLRARAMTLRQVPWEAFRHFRGNVTKVNTEYLAGIWEYSFRNAQRCISGLDVDDGSVLVKLSSSDDEVNNEFHRSLLRHFSPHLARICGRAMKDYIPPFRVTDWDENIMANELSVLEANESLSKKPTKVSISDHTLEMVAVVLGTLYGFISSSCKDNGARMNLASDVVFRPDLFFEQRRLRGWASGVGIAIAGNMPYRSWNNLVLEVVLGLSLLPGASALPENVYMATTMSNRKQNVDLTMNLGAQANGMVAVLQMIVAPSITSQEFLIFHVNRGQILSFPLTEDGFIQSSAHIDRAMDMTQNAESDLSALESPEFMIPDFTTRVDVEPHWEADPRKVVFSVRRHGLPVGTFNIPTVISYLVQYKAPCACSHPSFSLAVFLAEGWQYFTAEGLMGNAVKRVSYRSDLTRKDCKYLLDGRRSKAMTIYCIGTVLSSNVVIAGACLGCAYRKVTKRPGHAIIILSADSD
jgi:hypothetical protein